MDSTIICFFSRFPKDEETWTGRGLLSTDTAAAAAAATAVVDEADNVTVTLLRRDLRSTLGRAPIVVAFLLFVGSLIFFVGSSRRQATKNAKGKAIGGR